MNTTSFAETACNTHFSPFSRLRRRLTKSINTNQSEYSTLYLKSEKNRNNWETLTTRTDPREPWQQHKLYSDHRTLIQDLCKLYTDIFYLIWRVTSEKVTIDGYFPPYPFWNGNGKGITFFSKDTGKNIGQWWLFKICTYDFTWETLFSKSFLVYFIVVVGGIPPLQLYN